MVPEIKKIDKGDYNTPIYNRYSSYDSITLNNWSKLITATRIYHFYHVLYHQLPWILPLAVNAFPTTKL